MTKHSHKAKAGTAKAHTGRAQTARSPPPGRANGRPPGRSARACSPSEHDASSSGDELSLHGRPYPGDAPDALRVHAISMHDGRRARSPRRAASPHSPRTPHRTASPRRAPHTPASPRRATRTQPSSPHSPRKHARRTHRDPCAECRAAVNRPPVETVREHGGWLVRKAGYLTEYKTKATLLGLPLIHVASHPWDPCTRSLKFVIGFFALGPLAIGVFAVGWLSLAIFGVGVLTIALAAGAGVVASAGVVAVGNVAAAAGLAVGNVAIGYKALGQVVAQWRPVRN